MKLIDWINWNTSSVFYILNFCLNDSSSTPVCSSLAHKTSFNWSPSKWTIRWIHIWIWSNVISNFRWNSSCQVFVCVKETMKDLIDSLTINTAISTQIDGWKISSEFINDREFTGKQKVSKGGNENRSHRRDYVAVCNWTRQ